MSKIEDLVTNQFAIYSGIVANNKVFDGKLDGKIEYEFIAPEFETLKEKWKLEEIAGKGNAFEKAKKLLDYFSPKLTHNGNFDNHVSCNALDLLDYSYGNEKRGINCVCKAKIMQECLLALGIFARRLWIMPYSPFDFDNHVVTEMFDENLDKWIMIDPSTNAYIIDKNRKPLSMLEYREEIAKGNLTKGEMPTAIKVGQSDKNLEKLFEKNIWENQYFAKNSFYFIIETVSKFGKADNYFHFLPKNFALREQEKANLIFRELNAKQFGLTENNIDWIRKRLQNFDEKQEEEIKNSDIKIMAADPRK